MLKIILLFTLTSCATHRYDSLSDEVKSKNLTQGSILDLSRSSYLKGCTDSSRAFSTSAPNHFEACVKMAKKHEKMIREILESEIKKP